MESNWDRFWSSQRNTGPVSASWSKKRIVTMLDRHLRPGMKVLDAGCGSGFFSSCFLARGCSVTALDYSTEALEMTRRATGGNCARYTGSDLRRENTGGELRGEFDLIFSDGLLEHFAADDQRLILSNLATMTAPTGVIVTIVPNRFSFWQVIRPLLMPGIEETPFSASELDQLFGDQILVERGGLNVLPIAWSPDRLAGRRVGMLLYCVTRPHQ